MAAGDWQIRPAVLEQESDDDLPRRSETLGRNATSRHELDANIDGDEPRVGISQKRPDKWWHVSDDKIEGLIQQMARGGGGSMPSLPTMATSPSGRRTLGKSASFSGTSSVKRAAGGKVAVGAAAGDQSEALSALLLNHSRTIGKSTDPDNRSSSKRVHFKGDDAIDRLLARTIKFNEQGEPVESAIESAAAEDHVDDGVRESQDNDEPGVKGDWKITDEELKTRIEEIAAAADLTEAQATRSIGSLACAGASMLGAGNADSVRMAGRLAKGTASHIQSGTLARWKIPSDDRVSFRVFFTESGDSLMIRISPDLQVGPPEPPKSNRFTEIFGIGASTKGFCEPKKSFDYKLRKFGATQRPGFNPGYSESLKGLIEYLTGMEPAKQKLAHRNSPMNCNSPMADNNSLRMHGITDGSVISLTFRKSEPRAERKETSLTSSLKNKGPGNWEERLKLMFSGKPMYDGPGYSLRLSDHLKNCHAGGDVWMMPKWLSSSCPSLFAPVAAGVSGDGSMKAPSRFASEPIFLPDVGDPSLSSVREKVTGYAGYTMPYRRPDGR